MPTPLVVLRATVAAVLTAGLLVAGAGPVVAHARLVAVVPGDGAVVTVAPSTIELTFNEVVVQPSTVVVLDASGARVSRAATTVTGRAAAVRVEVTSPGRYTIAFRVLSADGHPVTGKTSFSYRPGSEPAASNEAGTAASDGSLGHPSAGHASAQRAESASSAWNSSSGLLVVGVAGLSLLTGVLLLTTLRRGRRAAVDRRGPR